MSNPYETPKRLFSSLVRIRALQAYEKEVNGKEYAHYKCDGGRGVSNAMMGKGGEPDEDSRYHYWVICVEEEYVPDWLPIKPFDHDGRKWIIFPK